MTRLTGVAGAMLAFSAAPLYAHARMLMSIMSATSLSGTNWSDIGTRPMNVLIYGDSVLMFMVAGLAASDLLDIVNKQFEVANEYLGLPFDNVRICLYGRSGSGFRTGDEFQAVHDIKAACKKDRLYETNCGEGPHIIFSWLGHNDYAVYNEGGQKIFSGLRHAQYKDKITTGILNKTTEIGEEIIAKYTDVVLKNCPHIMGHTFIRPNYPLLDITNKQEIANLPKNNVAGIFPFHKALNDTIQAMIKKYPEFEISLSSPKCGNCDPAVSDPLLSQEERNAASKWIIEESYDGMHYRDFKDGHTEGPCLVEAFAKFIMERITVLAERFKMAECKSIVINPPPVFAPELIQVMRIHENNTNATPRGDCYVVDPQSPYQTDNVSDIFTNNGACTLPQSPLPEIHSKYADRWTFNCSFFEQVKVGNIKGTLPKNASEVCEGLDKYIPPLSAVIVVSAVPLVAMFIFFVSFGYARRNIDPREVNLVGKQNKVYGLDGIRIIAAIHIMAFHLFQNVQIRPPTITPLAESNETSSMNTTEGIGTSPSTGHTSEVWSADFSCAFCGFGKYWVLVFFVISGFILTYTRRPEKIVWSRFMMDRVAPIVAIYYLSLVLMGIRQILEPKTVPSGSGFGGEGQQVATSIFMVQTWLPPFFAPDFNGPTWFVSNAVALWTLFPSVYRVLAHMSLKLRLGLTALTYLLSTWCTATIYLFWGTPLLYKMDYVNEFIEFSPINNWVPFLYGMLLATLAKDFVAWDYGDRWRIVRWICKATNFVGVNIFFLIAMSFFIFGKSPGFIMGTYKLLVDKGPLSLWAITLLLSVLVINSRNDESKKRDRFGMALLVALDDYGGYAFPLYLLHVPLGNILMIGLSELSASNPSSLLMHVWFYPMAIFGIVVVATIFIDAPSKKLYKKIKQRFLARERYGGLEEELVELTIQDDQATDDAR